MAIAERLDVAMGEVTVLGRTDCILSSIEHDNRAIAPGGTVEEELLGPLFCCLTGEHHDGHDHARDARRRGAVAFICERELDDVGDAAQLVVGPGRAREAMAHGACAFWGDPARSLKTVGVTGTNGKTTTTYLLCSIFAAAGYEPALVGTLSGARTTPESTDLQKRFELARQSAGEAGLKGAVALEVTSHALVQHRVDGYVHDVAVFTNLSQDHLDYHGTMEAYFQAKRTLFTPEHAVRGVVNSDDEHGRRLLEEAEIEVEPFSIADAEALAVGPGGSRFRLRGHDVALPLLGRLNVENALGAACAARALGISDDVIARGLTDALPVPGRFEQVPNDLELNVVVDYAHTPAGLAEACATMRSLLGDSGRLVVVFGAGGDRDKEKRPLMGHSASSEADVVVVTSDNPRHEEPDAIIEAIVAGCDGPAEVHVEADRRRAIALGLSLAGGGDLVLVAGKGHETTQQLGDEMVAFDDRKVVAEEASRLAGAA